MGKVDDWADGEARNALMRVANDDKRYHQPDVPEGLVEALSRMGVMVSTARWTETITDELSVSTHEDGTVVTDAELAAAVLRLPDALEVLNGMVQRAIDDCQDKGLHPIGMHLRAAPDHVVRGVFRGQQFRTDTTLMLTVRAVDARKLEELAAV